MACKNLHKVSTITATSTSSTVTFAFQTAVASLTDEQKFCLIIPCGVTVPEGSDEYTVLLTIGSSTVPLWDKYGNPATMNELKKGRIYCGYYGATTAHVISSKIPMTCNCACSNVL